MIAAILATQNSTPIIGQVAQLFGLILSGLFNLGIHNLGICIILFTIIVYMLQLPLTIKQQKFSRMQAIMNPEIQAIQKKYRNKRDQASQMKMQEETREVYDKYGTSMSSGCLPMLIQLPILYGFYRVIYNIPAYVKPIKAIYFKYGLVDAIKSGIDADAFIEFGKTARVGIKEVTDNTIVDVLWKLQDKTWAALQELGSGISGFADKVTKTYNDLKQYTTFLGLSIAESPLNMFTAAWANKKIGICAVAIIIPLLAGVTQFINVKLMPQPQQNQNQNQSDNPMSNSMKSMNYMFPIISVVFCFTLPFAIGIYWIMGSVVRTIQQVMINKHFDKMDVEEIVAKNREKAEAKRKKRAGKKYNVNNLDEKARTSTRSIKTGTSDSPSPVRSGEPREGSLAAKANMVKKYNEKNNK